MKQISEWFPSPDHHDHHHHDHQDHHHDEHWDRKDTDSASKVVWKREQPTVKAISTDNSQAKTDVRSLQPKVSAK